MFAYRFAFVSALLLTGVAVIWQGGRWERLSYAMLAVDFVLSPLLQVRSSWFNPQIADFVVDCGLLLGITWVAHGSQGNALRLIAALQTLYLLLYLPFWLFPHELYRAFYVAGNGLGYVQEGILVGACFLPKRERHAQDVKPLKVAIDGRHPG